MPFIFLFIIKPNFIIFFKLKIVKIKQENLEKLQIFVFFVKQIQGKPSIVFSLMLEILFHTVLKVNLVGKMVLLESLDHLLGKIILFIFGISNIKMEKYLQMSNMLFTPLKPLIFAKVIWAKRFLTSMIDLIKKTVSFGMVSITFCISMACIQDCLVCCFIW